MVQLGLRIIIYMVEIITFSVIIFTDKYQCYDLTDAELEQIFGNWRPDYSIFQPKFSKRLRTERSVLQRGSFNRPTVFQFNALGQNFKFRLNPVDDLFSSEFALISRNVSRGATILDDKRFRSCAFQGEGVTNPLKKIALVTCGNIRGVVRSPHEEFVIEPLPENVRRNHRRRSKRSSSDLLTDHIIYRRKQNNGCSIHEESQPKQFESQFEREYLHSRYTSLINNGYGLSSHKDRFSNYFENERSDFTNNKRTKSNTYYIETAVFVDKDLLKHMQKNFPTNTEEEVIQVVLAMVNAVQLLYNDPSLGHTIKYVLKRLDLLYEDPPSLKRLHDIDDFLTNFCSWQHKENPSTDADPFHWDHALILTGLDLFTTMKDGKVNSQVVGLAPVAGMCTRTSSCTVNEGRHFESVYVVAHEIGHNLGMRHDGIQSGNNCDPSGYLMSPTLGSGKVTWSHCSKRYLTKFLDTSQAKCLRDKPKPPHKQLIHESSFLPGERFTADQQCLLKYGVGSHSAMNQEQDDICRDLHCIRDHYTWTSHPALEGTKCGNHMWCRRGLCEHMPRDQDHYETEKIPTIYETKPDSFSLAAVNGAAWGRWSECRTPCLYGMDGSLSSGSTGLASSKKQCYNCKEESRYLVCSSIRECSIRRKRTLKDYADDMCRRLVRNEPTFTGLSVNIHQSGIRSCQIDCLSKRGTAIPSRTFFPDGTVCKTSATFHPTFCVAGFCTEFRCEANALFDAGARMCRLPIPEGPKQIPFGMSIHSIASDIAIAGDPPIWGPWETSSRCTFSCLTPSKGIQLVSRTCLDSFGCQGLDKNIQLCTPKPSECNTVESPFTYASKVCQRYSKAVKQLSGIGMQLTSISEDPNRGCIVACQDADLKYRFYKVNGKDGWFPFGTECSSANEDYKAFCLNGKCMEFNSDGTPLRNSDLKTDRRGKGRTLEFVAYDTIAPIILANRGNYPHWRIKKRSAQLKRTERELKTTSQRLPGSFQDSFLLSLIDEINATFTSNDTRKEITEFPIDLDNPLFHNLGTSIDISDLKNINVESLPQLAVRTPAVAALHKETAVAKTAKWKLKLGPCSVNCGEGVSSRTWSCIDRLGHTVDNSKCLPKKLHSLDSHQPCSAAQRCSKADLSLEADSSTSQFGKWLMGLVDDIKSKH